MGRAGPTGSKKKKRLIKWRSDVRVIPGPPFEKNKNVKHRHSGGVFVCVGNVPLSCPTFWGKGEWQPLGLR